MSNREPILTVGMVTALVVAVLGLLAAFGLPLSQEQQQALLTVVAAGAPIVTALLTWWRARKKTTPVEKRGPR
jgi:Na+/proline symporter